MECFDTTLYFLKESEMTLYTTGPCQFSNKIYSWKFQDPIESQFKYVEGLDTIASDHDRAAFAYQGGTFVLFSGKGKPIYLHHIFDTLFCKYTNLIIQNRETHLI